MQPMDTAEASPGVSSATAARLLLLDAQVMLLKGNSLRAGWQSNTWP